VANDFTSTVGATRDSTGSKLVGTATEKAIVAQLCSRASGLQPQPTDEQLKAFVRSATNLDSDALVMELSHKLVNSTWQTRVCAMSGIKAAAKIVKENDGNHPLAMAVASLASMPELFDPVLTHDHPAVRQLALECASALGFPTGATSNIYSRPADNELVDLLGGCESSLQQQAGAKGLAASADVSDPMEDLLGAHCSEMAHARLNAPAIAATDLLGGLDELAPPTPSATLVPLTEGVDSGKQSNAKPLVDMFTGLHVSEPASVGGTAVSEHEGMLNAIAGLSNLGTTAPVAASFKPQGQAPTSIMLPSGNNGLYVGPAGTVAPLAHENLSDTGYGSKGAAGSKRMLGASHSGQGAMCLAPVPQATARDTVACQPVVHGAGGASGQPMATSRTPMLAPAGCNMKGLGMRGHAKPKDAFDFVNDELGR
jgi:hypothetical protein